MQILKLLRNESANGDIKGEPKIALDGHYFTKDELLETRQGALDMLAREKDSDEINRLAIYVAGLDSAIEAFTQIVRAKAMAVRRARELDDEDLKAVNYARDRFREHCALITGCIMERAGDRSESYRHSDNESSYTMKATALFSKVHEALSFERAEAQFQEIDAAVRERREWTEVVTLPKYVSIRSGLRTWEEQQRV